MRVLLTGASGYIGSHTALELLNAGHDVVGLGNFFSSVPDANWNPISLGKVMELAGRPLKFVRVNMNDFAALFDNRFDVVIHAAAFKGVVESLEDPLKFYSNNLISSINLLKEWNIVILRYFNPAGAHPSGMLGEDPRGSPSNLMPVIGQVALRSRKCLKVFGNTHPTPDGTVIRDFVHVVDVAKAHVKIVEKIEREGCIGTQVYNIGSGKGTSLLEAVQAFQKVNAVEVEMQMEEPRKGDVVAYYSNPSKAERELGWKPVFSLEDACGDMWNWLRKNPNGYETQQNP